MLNNKGIYYAKLIVKDINSLTDKLIDENILKPADLGACSSLADISSSVSTEFSSSSFPAILIKGYSEYLYKNFYHMGSVNLDSPELAPAYSYFKELKDVYESNSLNKPFNYYKKYRVWAFKARKCLLTALENAEMGQGIVNKLQGTSYTFETNASNIINISYGKNDDFAKVGLSLPNSEGKYIQFESSEVFKEKITSNNSNSITTIINVIYRDDKERNSKIYPVVSTYNNKPLEIVKMISANDLIELLKTEYKAEVSNTIVDNEPLYQRLNEIGNQSLQPAFFFATGKNKVHQIYNCEVENSWPSVILNARSTKDLSNVSIYTKRSLDHTMTRKTLKRDLKSVA